MTEPWNADPSTLAPEAAPVLTQTEIDQRVLDLYDEYCHGRIDWREFLQRAGALTIGGVSALAMAQALLPRNRRRSPHAGSMACALASTSGSFAAMSPSSRAAATVG